MPSITKLLTAAPLKALFQRNLTIVADDAKRRLTMMIIDGMRDRVTGRDKMDDVLSDAMAALGDVSLTGSSVRAHTFQSVVTEIAAKRRERDANPSSDGPCMGTMTAIDTALGPLRPGGLYILAARPGVGKTSRALETCIQSIRDNQQRQVAFISLEVDRSDIVGKMIASQNRVSFRDYEQMSHEQLTVASSKLDFLEGHLDIIDKSHVTPQELMITCREIMLRRKRLDLVVVDYLQLLSAGSHGKDDVERISYISRSLKVLAKDLRVPVLALSQMSRDSEKGAAQGRPPREPRLTDLRGSGSIEQDADAVCFIHRAIEHEAHPSEDSPVRVIKYILAKNRFGPQSEAWSDFNAKIMSFTPRDEPNPVKTEDEQDPHMKILRERRDKQRPAMPFRMGIPADEHPIESRHDDNDDDDGFFGETGPARPLTAPPASTKPHPGHDNASQPSSSPTWRDL
jgi:replicative DNA helicase